jgi:hypothetical protein
MNYVKIHVEEDGEQAVYQYEWIELNESEVASISDLDLEQYESQLIDMLFNKNMFFIYQLKDFINQGCKIICFKKTTALKLARILERFED